MTLKNKHGKEIISGEDSHPLIVSYKETEKYTFPLILIIGREANFEGTVGDENAYYDDVRGCSFWEVSYKFIGKVTDDTDLIKKCEDMKASPIIYADASKYCIPHSNNNSGKKDVERKKTNVKDSFIETIKKIMKQDIFKRVKVIILSGHAYLESCQEFISFPEKLHEQLSTSAINKDIKIIETDFFRYGSSHNIEEGANEIINVYKSFLEKK